MSGGACAAGGNFNDKDSIAVGMKRTVLVVDDSPTNVRMLAELLRTEYNVMLATDGAAALDIIRSDEPPDLVLLDVIMPGMSGIDVCRSLKDDPVLGKIPVILMSADDPPPDPCAGETDYVRKPFAPADLLMKIKNAIPPRD